jgi:hypothetical protein
LATTLIRISLIFTLSINILLVSSLFFAVPALASPDDAQNAITSAQSNLVNCYNSVKDAEAAGANVTTLISNLNIAADLLSQAQLAYTSNDYNTAYNDALQSQATLNSFSSQASSLKQEAENTQTQNNLIIIISIFSSTAILIAGIGAYGLLNKLDKRQ